MMMNEGVGVRMMTDRRRTMIDLFSGAGGMTLGFARAGFTPIAAVERVPAFARTYEANFGAHVITKSIEQAITSVREIRADLVVGGPPCQGFSNLSGNRRDDHRRVLWRYFIDVVESSRCEAFVMENVPNLLTSPEGSEIIKASTDLGFSIEAKVLKAARFGVPQNRKRTFIVGCKKGAIELLDESGEIATVRDAFRGIPLVPDARAFSRAEDPVPTSALHIARNPTETSLRRYALIPPGGNRFDLQRLAPELTPSCWIRKTSGGTDLFGRLEWDRPARCTIRTEFYKPEKGRYLHPSENRPITHWEAARLQTFPDDFLWCGTKIEIAIQIGNAVPPKLAEAVGRRVWDRLNR